MFVTEKIKWLKTSGWKNKLLKRITEMENKYFVTEIHVKVGSIRFKVLDKKKYTPCSYC